jgi:hypothetical protein
MNHIIAQPLELRPALPTIEGNVDYQEYRRQLLRIHELLLHGGAEADFVRAALAHWRAQTTTPLPKLSLTQQQKFQLHSRRALRCNIARTLLGESLRGMSCRLADSPLLQWFCQIDQLDAVRVPSKSTLDRYAHWLPAGQFDAVIHALLQRAGVAATATAPQPLGLAEAQDLDHYFVDTTAAKANIHFPVDWVLLRDATRTLMKATVLIRRQDLMQRMRPPAEFLTAMNRLAIQMTHARRKADSQKQRKAVLRQMKKLLRVVRDHAQRHRDRLDEGWRETEWTRAQAEQVLRRLDGVLAQLPAAIQQAHERIIGERPVANAEKILSLYEPDVHVLVRGKAGAEVEFGNTLLLGELPSGLIVDWQLYRDQAPADSRLLSASVRRVPAARGGRAVAAVTGDRGFDSAANTRWLASENITNAICPRAPAELAERLRDEEFCQSQRRRGQTEGRIGIFKNQFLGRPLRAKSFGHRQESVAWGVLTHNLWVLARLPQAAEPAHRAAA